MISLLSYEGISHAREAPQLFCEIRAGSIDGLLDQCYDIFSVLCNIHQGFQGISRAFKTLVKYQG